jgi:hypothetical protein
MAGPDKYLLVLDAADHATLAGDADRGADEHHRRCLRAASTAFWRGHLCGDAAARRWLDESFAATLAPGDRFAR